MTSKEINRNFYYRRKNNGLCVNCGKTMDRKGAYCQKCLEESNKERRETRKWYQENGICPRCRKEKLYGDEKQCPGCAAKAYEIVILTRDFEKFKKQHAEWSKKTHHQMIEQGICTRCRKRKADGGYKTCGICRSRERERKRKKYGKPSRSERYLQGLCYFCDNPVKEGYKLCELHYQRNVEMSKSQKAVQARKELKEKGILY